MSMKPIKRPISAHIIADSISGGTWDRFLGTFERLRPSGAFVLGSIARAAEIKALCTPGADVAVRIYDPMGNGGISGFDNHFHQINPDVKKVVDRMEQQVGDFRDEFVFCFGYNEMGFDDSRPGKTLTDLIKWKVDFAYEAHERGFRVTLGEIATDKTIRAFSAHDVQNGRWDDYLRMIYDLRHYHIATFHEYTSFVTPINRITARGGSPLNAADVHPDNWDWSPLATQMIPAAGGLVMPPHYHIGRVLLLMNIRAEQIGLPPLPFWITECLYDEKHDIPEWAEAKARFKVAGYDEMRGFLGHTEYWRWIQNIPPEQWGMDNIALFLALSTEWYHKVLPSNTGVICPFTVAENSEWHIPAGFRTFTAQQAIYDSQTTPEQFFAHTFSDGMSAYWEWAIQYNDEYEQAYNDTNPVPDDGGEPVPDVTPVAYPELTNPHWYVTNVRVNHDRPTTFVRTTPNSVIDSNKVLDLSITRDWTPALLNLDPNMSVEQNGELWLPIIRDERQLWAAADWFEHDELILLNRTDEPDEPDTGNDMKSCGEILQSLLGGTLAILILIALLVGCTMVIEPTPEPSPTRECVNSDVTPVPCSVLTETP